MREEIARTICESDGEVWSGERSAFCDDYRRNADAVLALPVVRQLLADAAAVKRVRELVQDFAFMANTLHNVPAADAYDDASESIRRALDGAR